MVSARMGEAGGESRVLYHVTTAAAIGAQFGIEGEALTGAEFAALTDAELDARLERIGVVARVAPEDKAG